MSQRRRNHFIPRFLLKSFASKRSGKKSWIWQISAEGISAEISTKDAAVATDFYGGPATGVEDAFAEAEGRFAKALKRLASGESGEKLEHELKGFVWSLATRTRALRHQAMELFQRFTIQALSAALSVESDNALAQQFRAKLDSSLDSEVAKLPPDQRGLATAILDLLANREPGGNRAESLLRLPAVEKLGNDLLRAAGNPETLDRAGLQGQVKGLSGLLNDGDAPASFDPSDWSLEGCSSKLILGDGCVVAVRRDGWVGPLLLTNADWDALYLPISPSKVLVGYRGDRLPVLSAEEINTHSAELSWSHIFSSTVDASVLALASNIGRLSDSLIESEVSAVLSRLKRENVD